MINRRLTAAEAAARLGVKPATLYAYVSRGLLGRERSSRGSTFDAQEVARLARSARHPGGPGRNRARPPTGLANRRKGRAADAYVDDVEEPVFVTSLSLIDDGRLYYRGRDAVTLSREHSFEEVAAWLLSGEWPRRSERWSPPPATASLVEQALAGVPPAARPIERLTVAVVAASLADDFRHDLSPGGVAVTARRLIAAMCLALPAHPGAARTRSSGTISARVWAGLSPLDLDAGRKAAMEAALVLAADHELAPSTMAARVAASFRADPYAVVLTGLGPASGTWRSGSSGAPTEVEALLHEAAVVGPERAVGERLRRTGELPHGFGMPLYPSGDPRARELLRRVPAVGRPERWAVVGRLVALGVERGFPAPNMDLGLGALSFCAEMPPGSGQAISTLAKTAGWLAHAIEEYTQPTRFRSRADYVGPVPEPTGPDSTGES
ncbi:MAG: citrate synthase [Acidimicrobiales bacterium]|nr:citrate synthase [Acidimicrobiales bacterium]